VCVSPQQNFVEGVLVALLQQGAKRKSQPYGKGRKPKAKAIESSARHGLQSYSISSGRVLFYCNGCLLIFEDKKRRPGWSKKRRR
jgi:hypothetical protein